MERRSDGKIDVKVQMPLEIKEAALSDIPSLTIALAAEKGFYYEDRYVFPKEILNRTGDIKFVVGIPQPTQIMRGWAESMKTAIAKVYTQYLAPTKVEMTLSLE